MPELKPIPWKEFERFLIYIGCEIKRQAGDHRVYWRAGSKRPIILPTYKMLPIFVIRSNLKTLNLSVEDYIEILKKI